jgi:hypothetical protein
MPLVSVAAARLDDELKEELPDADESVLEPTELVPGIELVTGIELAGLDIMEDVLVNAVVVLPLDDLDTDTDELVMVAELLLDELDTGKELPNELELLLKEPGADDDDDELDVEAAVLLLDDGDPVRNEIESEVEPKVYAVSWLVDCELSVPDELDSELLTKSDWDEDVSASNAELALDSVVILEDEVSSELVLSCKLLELSIELAEVDVFSVVEIVSCVLAPLDDDSEAVVVSSSDIDSGPNIPSVSVELTCSAVLSEDVIELVTVADDSSCVSLDVSESEVDGSKEVELKVTSLVNALIDDDGSSLVVAAVLVSLELNVLLSTVVDPPLVSADVDCALELDSSGDVNGVASAVLVVEDRSAVDTVSDVESSEKISTKFLHIKLHT